MNINQWLQKNGFKKYTKLFEENEITIDELKQISSHDDLKEIGIKSKVHRDRLLIEIAALFNKPSGKAGQPMPFSNLAGKSQQKESSSSHKETDEIIFPHNPMSPTEEIFAFESFVGEFDEEEIDKLKKDIKVQIEKHGKNHEMEADCLLELGQSYFNQRRDKLAIENFKEALTIYKSSIGNTNEKVALCNNLLGLSYYAAKQDVLALEQLEDSIKIYRELKSDIYLIAACNSTIGEIYNSLEQKDIALSHLQTALELFTESRGEDSEEFQNVKEMMDGIFENMIDSPEKEDEEQKKEQIDIEYYNLNDDIEAEMGFGAHWYANEMFEDSLSCYLKALDLYNKLPESDKKPHLIARLYKHIGNGYDTLEDYDKALEYYFMSLDIEENTLGKEHAIVADTYKKVGISYTLKDDFEKAEEYFFKSLEIRKSKLGKEDPLVADIYEQIGINYSMKGEHTKTPEFFIRSLEIRKKALGEEHSDTATAYKMLGFMYKALKEDNKAWEMLEKAIKIREKLFGKDDPEAVELRGVVDSHKPKK